MRNPPSPPGDVAYPDPGTPYEDRDGSVLRAINELKAMTVPQLREKHVELYGFETRSRHKQQLFRRLAWRVQELKWGGLSDEAKARLEEIADSIDPFDARFLPPRRGQRREVIAAEPRRRDGLTPGTVLTREHDGQLHEATVLESGVEYRGKVYRSLSGVAREITGTQWNGKRWFGLVDAKGAPR